MYIYLPELIRTFNYFHSISNEILMDSDLNIINDIHLYNNNNLFELLFNLEYSLEDYSINFKTVNISEFTTRRDFISKFMLRRDIIVKISNQEDKINLNSTDNIFSIAEDEFQIIDLIHQFKIDNNFICTEEYFIQLDDKSNLYQILYLLFHYLYSSKHNETYKFYSLLFNFQNNDSNVYRKKLIDMIRNYILSELYNMLSHKINIIDYHDTLKITSGASL